MKKVLKIIGIICIVLLIAIISIVALLIYIGNKPVAPTDYQQRVETGGEIETKYMSNGNLRYPFMKSQYCRCSKNT